jgi:hypothetical protein
MNRRVIERTRSSTKIKVARSSFVGSADVLADANSEPRRVYIVACVELRGQLSNPQAPEMVTLAEQSVARIAADSQPFSHPPLPHRSGERVSVHLATEPHGQPQSRDHLL